MIDKVTFLVFHVYILFVISINSWKNVDTSLGIVRVCSSCFVLFRWLSFSIFWFSCCFCCCWQLILLLGLSLLWLLFLLLFFLSPLLLLLTPVRLPPKLLLLSVLLAESFMVLTSASFMVLTSISLWFVFFLSESSLGVWPMETAGGKSDVDLYGWVLAFTSLNLRFA